MWDHGNPCFQLPAPHSQKESSHFLTVEILNGTTFPQIEKVEIRDGKREARSTEGGRENQLRAILY